MTDLVTWSDIPAAFVIGICVGGLVGGFLGMFAAVKSSFKHALFDPSESS